MPHLSSELRGPYNHGFRCRERNERVKRLEHPGEHGWYACTLQQRPRRQRKRHLKSEFALLQTLSRLFHPVKFVKCWQNLSCCLAFMSSTKRESRNVHVVVVQRRQKKYLLIFRRSGCRRRRRCSSSLRIWPIYPVGEFAGRGPKFGPDTRTEAALIRNLTAFEHFLILSDFGSDVYRIFGATFPRRYM